MNEFLSKYYTLPFTNSDPYIYDTDYHMCLMYCTSKIPQEAQNRLLKVLNGEKDIDFNKSKQLSTIKAGEIFYGDRMILIVRGWGRLQYIKTDDPGLIQDICGQWVVDTLNNYNNN